MSTTNLKPIILYDIPGVTSDLPWSPNTMKSRYCLGYKRLPFTTVWVEYPDIAPLIASKGITNPPYTLPAIEDPNTGTFLVDSLVIATYLDETYPETPKVVSPEATRFLERAGLDAFSFGSGGGALQNPADMAPRLVFLVLAADRLNPVSKEYYHRTRTARLGELWTTIAEACAAGPEGRAERVRQGIEAIREIWHKATALYDRPAVHEGSTSRSGGPFVLGEEPCFADFAIAGRIKFVVDGLAASEVVSLTRSEGDRLLRLVEDLEKYNKY